MHGRFVTTKKGGSNCRRNGRGERRFGNAVLTRNRVSWKRVWRLPLPDGSERRKLICVGTRITRRATCVCSTHISPSGRRKHKRQIRKVARVVTPWVRNNRPVVLMGDFNVEPGSRHLNRIYNPIHEGRSSGVFREVDGRWQNNKRCRCGESTSGSRKIDYIFVSGRHWRGLRGDATHSPVSDHDPLRGKARKR
jgi:endonuclease/exonuclease/phosphatase family metal-dependent hydrolase